MACGGDPCDEGTKKPARASAEETEGGSDAGEDGVDGISVDAEPGVSSEMAIGLHLADHGFDGGASAQLAADGGGHSALLSGDEDLSALGFGAVAAIGASDGSAGDPLNLLNLAGQGVAVIGIARGRLRMPRTN